MSELARRDVVYEQNRMRTTPNGTKRSSTPLLARARIRYIRTVSYCTRVDDDAPRSRSLLQRPEVREDLIVGHVLDGFASIASRPPRVGRCRFDVERT